MARRATRRAPCRRAVSWYVVGIAHSISHPGEISQVTPPVCAGESKWRRLEFVSKYSEYRCLRFVSKYSERVAVLPGHQRGGPPPSPWAAFTGLFSGFTNFFKTDGGPAARCGILGVWGGAAAPGPRGPPPARRSPR